MSNQKLKLVTTNVFHRLGMATLIAVGWVIGIEVLITLGGLIMNHNLASFTVTLRGIPATLAFFINCILCCYFIGTPYADFKWAIQNGISRKTMWQGRLLALCLSTLAVFVLDELLSLVDHPVMSLRTLVVNFIVLLTFVVTCQAIGNGFGLLSRRWKWIVGIGIPVICGILLTGLVRLMLDLSDEVTALVENKQFVAAVNALFGNPVTPWVIWFIYFVIVLALTRVFNDHLQLRRD